MQSYYSALSDIELGSFYQVIRFQQKNARGLAYLSQWSVLTKLNSHMGVDSVSSEQLVIRTY